jgi:hypothetical protein
MLANTGISAMNARGSDVSDTIVPFPAPSKNGVSDEGDLLDKAGHSILGLLHRAAGMAEENSQHALGIAHKLSLQLRTAEDRIKDLEADLKHYQDRADRAEKWLYRVSVEIEQQFFKTGDGRPSQTAPRQTSPQDYARKK